MAAPSNPGLGELVWLPSWSTSLGRHRRQPLSWSGIVELSWSARALSRRTLAMGRQERPQQRSHGPDRQPGSILDARGCLGPPRRREDPGKSQLSGRSTGAFTDRLGRRLLLRQPAGAGLELANSHPYPSFSNVAMIRSRTSLAGSWVTIASPHARHGDSGRHVLRL